MTLNLEVGDILPQARIDRARGAKTINITAVSLSHKSNIQDFGHYADIDLDIGADAQATLPALIEESRKSSRPIANARSRNAARSWPRRTRRPGTGRSRTRNTVGIPAPSAWRACPPSCGR